MASQIVLTVTSDGSTPIEGLNATLTLTDNMLVGVQYTVEATSDRNGLLSFDLSSAGVVLKYEYTATVTAIQQTIDVDTYLPINLRYVVRLTDDGAGGFTDYNLRSTTVKVVSATVDVVTAKEDVDAAYSAYIAAKEAYEALLAAATTITLEQVETYEPPLASNIVTRLLEFQACAILPGIRYATNADLTNELALLERINRSIEQYSNLYPNIAIGDGEGIPYQ
jgi:hypothetical protein